MTYYIYILECTNGAYYTGYTTDILRRYQEHMNGTSKCKYTRSFPPRNIAACWELPIELSNVLRIERLVKTLVRKDKLAIIMQPTLLVEFLHAKGYEQEIIGRIRYYNT